MSSFGLKRMERVERDKEKCGCISQLYFFYRVCLLLRFFLKKYIYWSNVIH
jgi:hypothetical protein